MILQHKLNAAAYLLFFALLLALLVPTVFAADDSALIDDYSAVSARLNKRGEGTVIAVIADGFNTNNPLFALDKDAKVKLTINDIENFIQNDASFVTVKDGLQSISVSGKSNSAASYAKKAYKNAKIPFVFDYADNDFDVSGSPRGTYLAGAATANRAGGNSGFTAPAANAQLLLMKVFESDTNKPDAEATAEAITDAVNIGADAIVLGVVGNRENEQYLADSAAFQTACKTAKDAGVPIFSGAGDNDMLGAGSLYWYSYGVSDPTASMPDVSTVSVLSSVDGIVTVGCADSGYADMFSFVYDGSEIFYTDTNTEYSATCGMTFAQFMGEGTFDFVCINGVGTPQDFDTVDVSGKIAVLLRGELSFAEKVKNASDANAIAVIICNNDPETDSQIRMNIDGAGIPAVFIDTADGEKLLSAKSGVISIAADEGMLVITHGTSWGVSPELTSAVDICAVGGFIPTTAIVEKSALNGDNPLDLVDYVSGTVYAASTAAAEFVRAKSALLSDGGEVLDILKATATPATDVSGSDASPMYQGAGVICASDILNSAAVNKITASVENKAEISCDKNGELRFKIEVTLKNHGSENFTADMSSGIYCLFSESKTREQLLESKAEFYEATGTQYDEMFGLDLERELPEFVDGTSILLDGTTVSYGSALRNLNLNAEDFSPVKVSVPALSEKSYTLNFKVSKEAASALFDRFEFGTFLYGYIYFSSSDSAAVSVPYTVFAGDYAAAPLVGTFNFDNCSQFYDYNCAQTFTANRHFDKFITLGINNTYGDEHFTRANSSLMSISPSGTFRGELYLKIYPFRKIDSVSVNILDSSGKSVYSRDAGSFDRCFPDYNGDVQPEYVNIWSCRDSDNYLINQPDGKYTAQITFSSDFGVGGKTSQQIEFDFVIDTKPPRLLEYNITEADNSRCLEITVTDDFALQYITVYDALENVYEPSEDIKAALVECTKVLSQSEPDTMKLRYDITELMLSAVYVELGDYACNSVTERIFIGY